MEYKIPETMKAMVLYAIDDIRLVKDKPVPKPGRDEVLVKVAACGICGTDLKILHQGIPNMPPYGTFTPGHEWTGTVVAVGETVDEFKPGDRVAVQAHRGCGRCANCLRGNYTNCLNAGVKGKGQMASGMTVDGGFAEYAVHHVSSVYKIPDSMDFITATYVTTLGTALWATENAGGFMAGDDILVVGPGPIGLSVVQLCKALQAGRIILVGTREDRLEKGKELGADITINIVECSDPAGEIRKITGGKGVHLAYECAGNSFAADLCLHSVMNAHTVSLVSLYKEPPTVDLNYAVFNGIKLTSSRGEGGNVCRRAVDLLAKGAVSADKIMTHHFPIEEFGTALDYFVNRKDGAMKVVVTMY